VLCNLQWAFTSRSCASYMRETETTMSISNITDMGSLS
jgi:hypothetical protein